MKPASNLIGQKFGRLIVLERLENIRGYTNWRCRCDCGNEKRATAVGLLHKRVASCGCLRRDRNLEAVKTHGMSKSKSKAYGVWQGMRKRCHSETTAEFHRYGGRGIKICDRWGDFANFLADMGEPAPGMTIERKDGDGDYTPENCVWASRLVQGGNTCRVIRVEVNGEKLSLRQACAALGKKYGTVHMRIYRGASAEEALS